MTEVEFSDFAGRPILRWAGGKQYLLPHLLIAVAAAPKFSRYVEPFLGAATLLIALDPKSALVSDTNRHLIEAYQAICEDASAVAETANRNATADSAIHYYAARDTYNASTDQIERAGLFLYLNRTCFNGIFRVNRAGDFNVPYGKKARILMPTEAKLSAVANLLSRCAMSSSDFRTTLAAAGPGDFVYLDPPYPPLNETSYFTHYTKERFAASTQIAVSEAAQAARLRGASVLISNADTPIIRELYEGWHIAGHMVPRFVAHKKTRHVAHELLIASYPLQPSSDDGTST